MTWPMTEAFINGAVSWLIDHFISSLFFLSIAFLSIYRNTNHACINPCGRLSWSIARCHGPLVYYLWGYLVASLFLLRQSLLKGSVASEVFCEGPHTCTILGVSTKSLQVAFLMLIDTANLVFVIYPTYHLVITNFGIFRFAEFTPWSRATIALSTVILDVCVQNFYAYRIYCLSRRSPYLPAAISIVSLTEFSIGIVYSTEMFFSSFLFLTGSTCSLKHTHDSVVENFPGAFIATLSIKVLCDVLITVGMVYTLLSNRTQVRRTNSVLNLLAIYTINCGTLHLVFAISCLILFVKHPNTLKCAPSLFIMVRLSLCAFMAILNTRDNLRETLDGPGGVVTTFTSSRHARVPISWPRKR
ncbi:hypothetical protein EDB87DRAFT_578558 [Lactarius vividus]|nr:hypothetical protein EDB87DRAFT_578558 [Lactarius vividus]